MSVRPLLLDLFCGAGGAAMGYHRAGFDIIGVDIEPQPNYPFTFRQHDAIRYLFGVVDRARIDGQSPYAAIHASPPCHDHSALSARWGANGTGSLLQHTRELLSECGLPWIIENVPGAPMRADYKLCGCMFGLPGLRRERWFETSWHAYALRSPCSHTGQTVTVTGHPGGSSLRDGRRGFGDTAAWKRAMGIDWMTGKEMAQAIPPAYTEYIGAQLLDAIEVAA
jgi:DNA (cytosine-5)-methyltransferase 1